MIVNTQPLLTVVIPTHQRPQYLPRAVESALQAAPNGDVEVIVVPNGGDETWKESLALLLDDSRIVVSPVEKGHANVARNHGLRLAKGKYIRFLDDDDFLLEAAQDQLKFVIRNQLEICSGYILHYTDKDGAVERIPTPIESSDFILAVLGISGWTLPVGNIFLKDLLDQISWNENIPRIQDHIWMLTLCFTREWRWQNYENDVGVWFHHTQERVSQSGGASKPAPWVAEMYLRLLAQLEDENRLNIKRREKILNYVFQYAHDNFPNSPFYCHLLLRKISILRMDKKMKLLYMLLIEWSLFPYRYLKNQSREVVKKYQTPPMIRRIQK